MVKVGNLRRVWCDIITAEGGGDMAEKAKKLPWVIKHRDYGRTVVQAETKREALKKAAESHGMSEYVFSFGASVAEAKEKERYE